MNISRIMSFIIRDFIPESADEQIFDYFLDYSEFLFLELYPRDPLPPRDLSKSRMMLKIPGEKHIRKMILDDEENLVIASSFLLIRTEDNPDYEKNKHIADLFIVAREGYDFPEIAKKLLDEALDILGNYDVITTIETCCYRKREKKFWESLNAKIAIEGAQNRLYFEDVDCEMINDWRDKGHMRAKMDKIDLISFQKCPDDIIEDYTSLYSELENLVPLGEFEYKPEDETPKKRREKEERFESLGYDWYTLATREDNNEISGLTEIFYNKARPHIVNQELTGVKTEYRGRGLGKWLKAEMLVFIKNKFPDVEFVVTGNADMNEPMLSINDRMGFKKYLTEKCYTMKISDLPS